MAGGTKLPHEPQAGCSQKTVEGETNVEAASVPGALLRGPWGPQATELRIPGRSTHTHS